MDTADKNEVIEYLYGKLTELLAANHYSVELTQDGKHMVGNGNGYYVECDTLQQAVDYAVEKTVEQVTKNRRELNKRIMIELGVPVEQIS